MKLDCNGNAIDGLVTEIEVICDHEQDINIIFQNNTITIQDYDSGVLVFSTEALDNLIKGLQLAKKLGWLQEPKLVDDVADLELGEGEG